GNGDDGNGDDMAEAELAATGAPTVTLAVVALLLAVFGGGLLWYNRSRQAGV
ncbi:MAG: LPXTG cell wall anchor domain-containing protein, partial [Nitriliruptorales bacterium]|nr:LPXTG cell wall anchor domain-containing protein [Nitriliruptorales bacterium]